MNSAELAGGFLAKVRAQLVDQQERIDHCVRQLNAAQIWKRFDSPQSASIGNLVLHIAGHVDERVSIALDYDPVSPRDRNAEFETYSCSLEQLFEFAALRLGRAAGHLALWPSRLPALDDCRGYFVLGRPRSQHVLGILIDVVVHTAGHTQEIVRLTRMQLGDDYRFFEREQG
jgi:hypothetical protein